MVTLAKEILQSKYEYKYGFHDDVNPVFAMERGLNERVVREISRQKNEPEWMLNFRLKALRTFFQKPMPKWGANLSEIDFDEIIYYVKPSDRSATSWEDVPEKVRKTFDRLGIPQAEQKFLGGVGAQYESEVVYHSIREDLAKKGVVFLGMDQGLQEHPELVKKFFGTVVPIEDNKFAALNSAVWSGGSFVYVPPGVHVDMPLQAYFRINAERLGQFERTLIIADEGASVHYIEGCTAPLYSRDSLHTAVVEVIAMKNAKVRYTTIQNWSANVYNLVTKRAFAYEGATVEWVDGNLGCLASDTKIFVNNDVKPISSIETGDMVFALNQNFELERRMVMGKKYSGKRPVYRLLSENHREIIATANHPFLSLRKIGKRSVIEWTRLDELKAGDMIAVSGDIPDYGKPFRLPQVSLKKVRKHIKTPQATTDELMWFLGFYLGDGYCERARVNIVVPTKDKSFERVRKDLEELFGVDAKLHRNIALRVASAELVQLIRELGFKGKATEKRVPAWVFTLPKSQRRAFIEGYIAADGHRRANHKNISITSCSRALLEDVKQLAISCGLNPLKISKWRRVEKKPLGREKKEYTHYFLYFSDNIIEEPVAFVRISTIEPVGETDTWDIEIEGAHNFVANGFIVHNSKVTMKYPSVYLLGPNAKADMLSIAFAGPGQHQDAGSKAVHLAPNTSSRIISKSVSMGGGRTTYRGLVRVDPGCKNVTSSVRCDALILDEHSSSDTVPYMEIYEDDVSIGHEATVGKINDEALFYLMSRGLKENEAVALIIKGFIEAFTKELPMEYAIELNRLIELEMEGAVG